MTLSVLEGHSPIASLFKCNISYLYHITWSLCIFRASCILYYHLQFTKPSKTVKKKTYDMLLWPAFCSWLERGGLVLSRTCRPGLGCSNCGSDTAGGFSVGST